MASIYKRARDKGRKDRSWYISYTDEQGRRRTVRGCPDRDGTRTIARHLENQAAQRRTGARKAVHDRLDKQGMRPITEHVDDYLADCLYLEQDPTHIGIKRTQLKRLIEHTGAVRLDDLEPNNAGKFLQDLKRKGLSARTVNHHRTTAIAFLYWCVTKDRLGSNPLGGKVMKLLDEDLDKRRVRRALSEDELAWLLSTAPPHRSIVYRVAYWTGLRRRELRVILVRDFDLERRVVHVRAKVSKAKRDDWIALRAELAETLAQRPLVNASPTDRMFLTLPSIRTFHADCERARRAWIDAAPDNAERERREGSDFLKRFDAAGRQVDLHGMRKTLNTHLARNNVALEVRQSIMRHADPKTTIKHYTDLRLDDNTSAIESMPTIDKMKTTTTEVDSVQELSATGTDGVAASWQRIDSAPVAFGGDDGQPMAKCDITGPSGQSACEASQVPYNQMVGDYGRLMATQGESGDETARKSLK